jgi:hypothetical protein
MSSQLEHRGSDDKGTSDPSGEKARYLDVFGIKQVS